jgi:AMP-polyphosphate phosphotransferase
MALFDHSWYSRVLDERCNKVVKKKVWRQAYQQINEFERWLADDGQVLIKFWLHISKKEQKKRMKEALRDPLLRWKVTKDDHKQHRQYKKWLAAVEEMLAKTTTPWVPWTLVPAHDLRLARVRVFNILAEQLEKALAQRKKISAGRTITALSPHERTVRKKTTNKQATTAGAA